MDAAGKTSFELQGVKTDLTHKAFSVFALKKNTSNGQTSQGAGENPNQMSHCDHSL